MCPVALPQGDGGKSTVYVVTFSARAWRTVTFAPVDKVDHRHVAYHGFPFGKER